MLYLKTYAYALVAAFSVTLTPSLYAGGPFGLFDGCNQACDSICGSSCDSGCCDGSGNGCCDNGGSCDSGCDSVFSKPKRSLFNCGLFGNRDGNSCCDSDGCDSQCDSRGEKSGCNLFGCSLFGKNSGCDSGCDSACDSGCNSGCDSMGCQSNSRGYYVSLFGGFNELDNVFSEGDTADFNDGVAFGGAIGRRFGKSVRGELEGSFRTNTGESIADAGGVVPFSGHLYTYAGMANLYYDLHQIKFFGFSPYAGAGLGFAIADGSNDLSDVDDTEFAYQFIVGSIRQLRHGVSMFSEYRNFNFEIDDADFEMDTYVFGLRFDR